ncbi:MAG: hypothetical protein FD165_707 [Gammaproteobacteria bacterium]|nr:MAG: hypothetical protein FD165_707 [Gammaproteobacteria bacterium]TND07034.1 MAG: hypothetical protein FD120_202 [Gammaproteobacteria bacterium]
MKILVVGDGHSEIHEVAVAKAFRELGHEVEVFYWHKYFITNNPVARYWLRAQNKFIQGPRITALNRDLAATAHRFIPEMIFIYRGTHVLLSTILDIKTRIPSCAIVGYNNDDPFAPGHSRHLWKNYIASVPHYDVVFAYRHRNIEQLRRIGAKRVELLRSWFIPWLNQPIDLTDRDRETYESDVVFVGHYEADERKALLESVVKQGWQLRLFGPGYDWDPVIRQSQELAPLMPVRLVWGQDYNKALCGAKIALCFLSKLNRDTYTRRCFEIPASGTLMLAEYTDDLASLYREGEEAEYFRTPEEMIAKIELYMVDATRRKAVADAGFRRVYKDGHDVVSRMRYVLDTVANKRGSAHENI